MYKRVWNFLFKNLTSLLFILSEDDAFFILKFSESNISLLAQNITALLKGKRLGIFLALSGKK